MLLETLKDPSMLHAAIVHFPVVLFLLCVPMTILSLAFPDSRWLRTLTLGLFLLTTASCIVAEETGEGAQSNVPNGVEQIIWDQVNEHASMAETLKFIAGAGALFSLLALIPQAAIRRTAAFLALCVALGGAAVTAVTAHYGGALVYGRGIGTVLIRQQLADKAAAAAAAAAASPSAPVPAANPELVPVRPIDLAEAAKVSFESDIKPILEKRCLDCHEGAEGDGDFDVTSIEAMVKGGKKHSPGLIPGNPDGSALVQYIRGELTPRMPKKKPPMPEEELNLIRLWIAAGAKDDASPAPIPVPTEPAAIQPAPVPAPAVEPVAPAPESATTEAPVTESTPRATESSQTIEIMQEPVAKPDTGDAVVPAGAPTVEGEFEPDPAAAGK